MPDTTDTFQALALNTVIPTTSSKIFTSIEMGILDNKAHLLTTKSALEAATTWVDTFVMKMNKMNENAKYWQDRTEFDRPPERIDRPHSSDAQIAYANFLDQSIAPLVGDTIEDSGAQHAPTRLSYSRVVYGGKNNKNNTSSTTVSNNTQNTEVSTITSDSNSNDNALIQETMNKAVQNMQEQAKQGQREMRQALLDEMTQIRKDHTDRSEKMEDSVEVFEHMIRELHESNKEKSKEIAQYEKRLGQLGMVTAKNTSAVQDLKTTMGNKMDILNLTMKAFIIVMADTVCKDKIETDTKQQKKNLLELSKLLEEDVRSQDMDLEESEYNTQEPLPGSGEALGGKGNKK